MRNAWIFAGDPNHWLPLPQAESLTADQRKAWLDAATVRIARANLELDKRRIAALREECERLLDAPRTGEACVYFPVMEPHALGVDLSTLDTHEFDATLAHWTRDDAHTVSVEVSPLEHPVFGDAVRVMRVDRNTEGVRFGVAFAGRSTYAGLVMSSTTEYPLLAGQLGGVGVDFFETFEPQSEHVGG